MKSYIVQSTHLILMAGGAFINPILYTKKKKKNWNSERKIMLSSHTHRMQAQAHLAHNCVIQTLKS